MRTQVNSAGCLFCVLPKKCAVHPLVSPAAHDQAALGVREEAHWLVSR